LPWAKHGSGQSGLTQTKQPPRKPGRFTWKLKVIDDDPWYYGDYGTLNSWNMTF
jgi:pseudomonalisin/xanthomonalisin